MKTVKHTTCDMCVKRYNKNEIRIPILTKEGEFVICKKCFISELFNIE